MKKIKIKYHDSEMPRIEKIHKGDWIDLRLAEDVEMSKDEYRLLSLGISIELPQGYEAHMAPRSSTFKHFGIISTNSLGIVDCTYCGDEDIWRFPAYALRDTTIPKYSRICQFRIVENMPKISFEEVESLSHNTSRGGFGSTGKH